MEIVMAQSDVQAIAAAVVETLKMQWNKVQEAQNDDVVMGVPELAEYLGMSVKWVYDQTASQRIPCFKLGNVLKFRKKTIDKWLRSFEVPAVEQPTAARRLTQR